VAGVGYGEGCRVRKGSESVDGQRGGREAANQGGGRGDRVEADRGGRRKKKGGGRKGLVGRKFHYLYNFRELYKTPKNVVVLLLLLLIKGKNNSPKKIKQKKLSAKKRRNHCLVIKTYKIC
jgi:hypothetical protein